MSEKLDSVGQQTNKKYWPLTLIYLPSNDSPYNIHSRLVKEEMVKKLNENERLTE